MAYRDRTPACYVSPRLEKIELGPAMRALSPRDQAVVGYLIDTGSDNFTEACAAAGFSKDGSQGALRVTASEKRRSPKIHAAIREVASQLPSAYAPMALQTTALIAGDPSHKDALRASLALLAMCAISPIARSQTETTVSHTLDPLASIEAKLAMLPKEAADALRRTVLPAPVTMIDVTPTCQQLNQSEIDELLADL